MNMKLKKCAKHNTEVNANRQLLGIIIKAKSHASAIVSCPWHAKRNCIIFVRNHANNQICYEIAPIIPE